MRSRRDAVSLAVAAVILLSPAGAELARPQTVLDAIPPDVQGGKTAPGSDAAGAELARPQTGTDATSPDVPGGASSAPTTNADTPPPVDTPSRDDITRALQIVKADPNLATERTIKSLRWRDSNAPQRPSPTPRWALWIAGLFRWFSESARWLMWCTIAGLAGLLVVFILRLVRSAQMPQRETSFVAPTHVRDLDIRPETLPNDIGAAARALWDRGEHRAALALLYRGLLSRLAHVHRIPIRDSTTEGDCLTLTAASQLAPRRREYAAQLVRVWQRAVYGHEQVQPATVYGLCNDFAAALDAAYSREAVRGSAR